MASGTLDSNGVWIYGEDDPASPFSDLLNLGMDSVSDAIGDAKVRITALEDVPTLPDPETVNGANANTIVATSWAALPSPLSFARSYTHDMWCLVEYSAWLVKTSGTVDLRSSVEISGATTLAPQSPQWSQVIWSASNETVVGRTMHISKVLKINAGSNTFTARAYVSSGSANLNYTRISITPLRFA